MGWKSSYCGGAAVIGVAVLSTAGITVPAAIATGSASVLSAGVYATIGAAIFRTNGGILQGRGGGGFQNARQGAFALAVASIPNVAGRLGRGITGRIATQSDQIAEALTGAASNIYQQLEPGQSVSCLK